MLDFTQKKKTKRLNTTHFYTWLGHVSRRFSIWGWPGLPWGWKWQKIAVIYPLGTNHAKFEVCSSFRLGSRGGLFKCYCISYIRGKRSCLKIFLIPYLHWLQMIVNLYTDDITITVYRILLPGHCGIPQYSNLVSLSVVKHHGSLPWVCSGFRQ